MSTDVVNAAYSLIYSTLHNDSTFRGLVTGVYMAVAPPGTQPDWCILNLQSGQDTNSAYGVRIMSRLTFQVQIIGPATDDANIRAAWARADALLFPNGQPTRNQGSTLAIYREQPLSYLELVNGSLWMHYGGLVRAEVA